MKPKVESAPLGQGESFRVLRWNDRDVTDVEAIEPDGKTYHFRRTFTRFLTEVRMDAVKRQLIETDLPIGEIAFSSGFSSLSHFNHKFVDIHGESPSKFRRKVQ
ncbi:MAG: AraC family transcriptional regulator [Pirellulales bacterium]|nr:AraC family transcriptional regulator [Pirellulales bacterium]